MSTPDEIEQMLADIESRESRLSHVERDFIEDISVRLRRGASLTEKQDAWLERIWNRVTE